MQETINLIQRRLQTAAVILVLLLAVAGCSSLNGTRLEPVLGGEYNLVKLGDDIAESLVRQSIPPLYPRQPEQPVFVTTVVNNDSLAETTSFGRSLQNSIIAGFVGRGYTVKEIKLRKDISVEVDRGEFMLTRELRELAGRQRAQAVVVGTYTMANRVMYLSLRLVSPADQTIRAAYEKKLYLDENTLRMLGLQFSEESSSAIQPPAPSVLDSILY